MRPEVHPAHEPPAATAVIDHTGALDVRHVLDVRGHRSGLTTAFEPGVVWRGVRTPDGPASVRVEPSPGRIAVDSWGPGADWLVSRAHHWLGAHDDPGDVDPLDDAVVARMRRRAIVDGRRHARTGLITIPLLSVVIGQKVPARDAERSRRQLYRLLAAPAPGPVPHGLRVPPDPDDVAALSSSELHRMGIERQRGDRVRLVAARARQLERAADLDPGAATDLLTALPGLGIWCATSVLGSALGDPDIPIVGDYGIPAMVTWNLAGERTGDDRRMLELLEPFGGQRGRVQAWIMSYGARPPRRGPRLSVPDVRRF